MAYEVSGSIAAGNVVSTFVPARASTFTRGGIPSPNGAKIAASSYRHGGAGSDDYGIDIWHSGSSGWEEAESIDTGSPLPYAILWYDDNTLFTAESDNKLRSYTSGSGGWTALERGSLRSATNQHMFWSPGKTRLITTNNNSNAPANDDFATVLTSGSTTWGAFIMGNSIVQAKISAVTWPSENDLIIGMSEYDTSAGMIKHLRYDGSSDWNEVSRSVGFNSNSSNTKQLGTMVYYNTGSNELLIGANTANDASPVINVIQSSSEGYFPADGSNLHLAGSPIRTVIDHSVMGITSADYPPDGLRSFNGLSLFPDRSDGNRFFVHTTAQKATPYDDTVYAIVESGSSGYRFSQLENNAIMGGGSSEYASGLSDGSTLYVAHGTGALSILGFTVYENILSGTPAGFTLSQSATPLNITEGATGTVGVVLNKQPSSNVVLSISLAGSFSGRASLTPDTLTFTNGNWDTQQNVTVSATANNIDDDNATGNITFSITDGLSDDEYDPLSDQAIALTVVDNNTAGFTLTPSASPLSITEGSTGTISVVLNSQPASGNVVIDVTPAGGLSGRASPDKSSLTFTTANWNSTQTVTVTAIADNIDKDNVTANITFSVNDASTTDTKFDALSDQTVAVTITDNDTAAFVVAPDPPQLSTTENGASATLSVKLATEPTHDVTVTLTGLDTTENTMSPNPVQLVFDSSNFSTSQTITLTGIEDEEVDGNTVYTMTLSATSTDSKYNNMQKTITVTNVDSGNAAGSSDDGSTGATTGRDQVPSFPEGTGSAGGGGGNASRTRGGPSVRNQADILPRRMHFEPSTIETIDRSVLHYFDKLDLFANTNEGWKKVPVVWGTAERSFQVKSNKDIRDSQGMLKLPIISIRRASITKDMGSKGVFQANLPEERDEQGGSMQVSRVVYQEKTSKFASADALRLHDQANYPRPNPKVVYRTISAPMPVNVTVTYEIVIRTEYQQQMNNLILPFVTKPGTINYIRLFEGEHRYEAFIQGEFQNGDNLSDFSSEERKFETKIQLKVIGYLIGQEDNREKPHYSIRENAVEVKIPRERISLSEVPAHEFGAYYGLSGITDPLIFSGVGAPFFFSNVPAVGSSAGSAAGGDNTTSGNLVTTTNFSQIMADNLVIREVLKTPGQTLDSMTVFTIATSTIRSNTESVYLNGVLQEVGVGKDYTISGNTITFSETLVVNDNLYITYIKS